MKLYKHKLDKKNGIRGEIEDIIDGEIIKINLNFHSFICLVLSGFKGAQ